MLDKQHPSKNSHTFLSGQSLDMLMFELRSQEQSCDEQKQNLMECQVTKVSAPAGMVEVVVFPFMPSTSEAGVPWPLLVVPKPSLYGAHLCNMHGLLCCIKTCIVHSAQYG